VCEQLAQGRYLTAERPGVELATSRVASRRRNNYTTSRPHCVQYAGLKNVDGRAFIFTLVISVILDFNSTDPPLRTVCMDYIVLFFIFYYYLFSIFVVHVVLFHSSLYTVSY